MRKRTWNEVNQHLACTGLLNPPFLIWYPSFSCAWSLGIFCFIFPKEKYPFFSPRVGRGNCYIYIYMLYIYFNMYTMCIYYLDQYIEYFHHLRRFPHSPPQEKQKQKPLHPSLSKEITILRFLSQ